MLKELVKQKTNAQKQTALIVGYPEFDWDMYAEDCPTRIRKGNPHVKVAKGVKVYSQSKNVQQLYDLYSGSFNTTVAEISAGDNLTGKIFANDGKWASIDVGYREFIYIDIEKEEPTFREMIVKDIELSVKVITRHKERGFIIGSVTEGFKQSIFNELLEVTKEKNKAYAGKVNQMIPGGGYMVTIQGVECFMPGSLAGINKLTNFELIVGTDLYVVPISYSHEKGTIVVSHRRYLQALIPDAIEALRKNIEAEYEGNITGSTKYGVFVEFNGCLTGMIHVNDLSGETAESYAKGTLEPGTLIKFLVKEIISNTKIALTQKLDSKANLFNPWNDISKRYNVPCKVQGTVKSIKDYGLFVNIEDGITGLLHISELAGIDVNTIKKGAPITVVISKIEEETRKVFLKLS